MFVGFWLLCRFPNLFVGKYGLLVLAFHCTFPEFLVVFVFYFNIHSFKVIVLVSDPIYLNDLDYDEYRQDEFSFGNRTGANGTDREGPVLSKLGSSSTAELHPKNGDQGDSKPTAMPPASVMTRLILIMVWRKLIRNPNTYSSLIGLTWSLVSFKYAKSNHSLIFGNHQTVIGSLICGIEITEGKR